MHDETIMVYRAPGDQRWYIGIYDMTKRRMICHIGRQDRGYGTRDAALGDLNRITSVRAKRYDPWANGWLDWEGAGL